MSAEPPTPWPGAKEAAASPREDLRRPSATLAVDIAEDDRPSAASDADLRRKRRLTTESEASAVGAKAVEEPAPDLDRRFFLGLDRASAKFQRETRRAARIKGRLRRSTSGDDAVGGSRPSLLEVVAGRLNGIVEDASVHEASDTWWQRHRQRLAVAAVAVVAIAAVAGAVVGARGKNAGAAAAVAGPSYGPCDPTRHVLCDRLAPVTPGGWARLRNASTPYHRAWQRLLKDGPPFAAGHLHQRYAMLALHFFDGPQPSAGAGGAAAWGGPAHECAWEGVVCRDAVAADRALATGRGDGIRIELPLRIVDRLHLDHYVVNGRVSPDLSLLYYLRHLDLRNTNLIGVLPAPVYELSSLQTLLLEQNALTNIDAIGGLRHLEVLSLWENDLRGPLPASFGELNKLKTLSLQSNKLTGELFETLGNITALEVLDVTGNHFEGRLPTELGLMSKLTRLAARWNKFQGTLPAEIGSCANLEEIKLGGSPDLEGTLPTELGRLANLTWLDLSWCGFNGTLPASLGNLTRLTHLKVHSNELEGRLPTSLGKLEQLTYLDIIDNRFEGEIPTQLGKATNLEFLGLEYNDFVGDVPSQLGMLTKLEKLYLGETGLAGRVPDEVCALRDRNDTTVLQVLEMPCAVACDDDCCTDCSE